MPRAGRIAGRRRIKRISMNSPPRPSDWICAGLRLADAVIDVDDVRHRSELGENRWRAVVRILLAGTLNEGVASKRSELPTGELPSELTPSANGELITRGAADSSSASLRRCQSCGGVFGFAETVGRFVFRGRCRRGFAFRRACWRERTCRVGRFAI